jgi:hypothetical protein
MRAVFFGTLNWRCAMGDVVLSVLGVRFLDRRYTADLQGEADSAPLYRTLAQTDKNPQLVQVYRRLAATARSSGQAPWRFAG